MSNIEINFSQFIPTMSTFYSYFAILKAHDFIKEIEIVVDEGKPTLRVHRIEALTQMNIMNN